MGKDGRKEMGKVADKVISHEKSHIKEYEVMQWDHIRYPVQGKRANLFSLKQIV